MQQRLRILLYALFIFCGGFLLAPHTAYAQPATVVISEVMNPCGAASDGSFQVIVTAGAPRTNQPPPFRVVAFNSSTAEISQMDLELGVPEIVSGLSAGNIVISVEDGDPTPNFTANITLTATPEITSIATTAANNTEGTCVSPNGSITINAINGGSGNFTFAWTGPNGFSASTQNITGLSGGDYVVTISDTDANCSFTSGTITLTDPIPNPFAISTADATPCSNSPFTVDLSVGEAGVEYELYVDGNPTGVTVVGPATTLAHPGLPAGPHTISVFASMGACTPIFSSNTLNFTVDAGPTSAVLGGDANICGGGSADLSVVITGGTGPYTVTIDNGVGTLNNYVSGTPIPVNPASTTVYNIVGNVVDANGCEVAGSGSATVTVNPAPTATLSGGGGFCTGSTGPTVTLTFTGTAPFDFTYTDGTTPVSIAAHNSLTYTIPNAIAGTYAVTALADNDGCPGISLGTPVAVFENPLPTASSSGGGTICTGDVLPGVTFNFTGTAPFNFTYTDGTTLYPIAGHTSNTFSIPAAPAGSYSVTELTDANTCAATNLGTSADVIVNPLPEATITGGGFYCEGSTPPSVSFAFTGTAPFDFTYTDGTNSFAVTNHPSATFDINAAAIGTYSITALSDNNGCVATTLGVPVDVAENPRPTAAVSGGGTVCAGSILPDVTFTFTGTAPFNFTYTDGSTPVVVSGHGTNTYTVANAAMGTYSVTALTDDNGCSATSLGGSANVVVDPLPTASITGGGSACAGDPLPGVTFTFTGAAPFDFTYTNGVTPVTINNHNFSTFTIPNAPAGSYAITALTDDKGCVATDLGTPVEVTQHPLPTANTSGGGTVCVDAALPDVTFTFTGTAPFAFTYTDGTTPVTIGSHNANDYTITGAAAGSYSVTSLSDANGCAATDLGGSTEVLINTLPEVIITGGGSVCEGSTLPSVTFAFTGAVPFDFTYSDGTNTFTIVDNSTTFTISNAAPGTYSVTALSDNNGCSATVLGTPVTVTENPLPAAAVSGGGMACAGSDPPDVTFTFTGTAPFTFTYTDGGATFNVNDHNASTFVIVDAPAGDYSVTALTDANSCVATDLGGTVNVAISDLPTAAITGGGVYCEGSPHPTVTFTFTGAIPFDFTYTDGTTPVTINGHNALTFDIPNAPEGVYSVTALTDANACAGTGLGSPVNVTETPKPVAVVSGGGTVCDGTTLPDITFTFTGTAPFDFTYTDGATPVTINGHNNNIFTISGAAAGSYSVTALADAGGCVATDLGGNADVIVNALPTADITGGGMYCQGSPAPSITFTFTGALPFDFTYTDGTTPVTINGHNALTFDIPNAPAGTYSITALTDNNGCAATVTGTPTVVTENPLPSAVVSGGGAVCSDDTLPDVIFTFTGTAPFDFTYTDGVTPVVITGHNTNTYTIAHAAAGTYSITALADVAGCVATSLGGNAIVSVEPAATAEAGDPQMICAGGITTLSGASVGGSAATGAWSIVAQPTGGDGLLSDVAPTATPSAITFSATIEGTYTLRLTTDDPAGLCDPAVDEVVITVTAGATASAGPAQTICESELAQLAGTFTGTTGIVWTTSGDGTFDDASLINAVYTPGANDKTNGSAILTITTAGPCAPVSADVMITIGADPVVDAGPPATICSSAPVVLSASFGGSATGLLWTTSGDGSFDDPTDPNASYTPGSGDATNGSVVLTATATGSCAGFSDNVTITVDPAATVDAGSPVSTCIGNTVPLNATIGGTATAITWTTAGDGSFDDASSPTATYIPGANDLANGTVTLTATTNNPAGPCPAANDNVVITFIALPGDQVTAGNETWIGYVYDDSADPAPYPGKVDFNTAKYRGFVDATDINGMNGTSSYDVTTDMFDLNLQVDPIQGPNICGSYADNFSVRYKMDKTFSEGVYRFTVGSDDGVRLLIDGVEVIPPAAFGDHAYTTYTTALPVCLSGLHTIEIQYYENAALSRLTFEYEEVPPVTTNGPLMQVCVDSSAPTLVASSTDADVVDFNWYKDGALVFTGASYTPGTGELDMTTATTTIFTVRGAYACGESAGSDIVVDVLNSATLAVGPQTVCESGGPVDLRDFVAAVPAGGTFSFTGHPNISGNTFDPSALAGTTVAITVDYTTGACTAPQATFDLTITSTATINVPAATPVVCESSPVVDLTTLVSAIPSGGAFVFTGNQVTGNNFDPSGLSGLQTITVDYSVGGCAGTPVTFDIEVTTTATVVANNATVCENGSALNLLTLVTPTPPGGNFLFSGPGVAGNLFNPLGQTGVVNITADYDINGCTASASIQVTVLDAGNPLCSGGADCFAFTITTDPLLTRRPSCSGQNDGAIVLDITGDTPGNYVMDLLKPEDPTFVAIPASGPSGKYSFTALSPGNYQFRIVDVLGNVCIRDYSLPVNVTVDAEATDFADASCFGEANGQATLTVLSGGDGSYEYSLDGVNWNPFTSPHRLTALPPNGTYTILVRDGDTDPCPDEVTVTINNAVPAITTTFDITDATCNGSDGAITNIVPVGGNGAPYTYSLDGGLSYQAGNTFTDLLGGNYVLRVRDVMGCEQDIPVTVVSPGYVDFSYSKTDINCQRDPGSISIAFSDPGEFLAAITTDPLAIPADNEYATRIGTGDLVFPDLVAGRYYVFVKSATSLCAMKSNAIDILEYEWIDFDIAPHCNGTEMSISLANVTGLAGGPQMTIYVYRVPDLNTEYQKIDIIPFPSNGEVYLDHDDYAFLGAPGEYKLKAVQIQLLGGIDPCEVTSVLRDVVVPTPLSASIGTVSESYPDVPSGELQIVAFAGGVFPYDVRIELDSASSFSMPFYATDFDKAGLNSNQQVEMQYREIPPGRYIVEVMDAVGCMVDLTARVPLDVNLFVPNVFTPNGDASNDVFFIRNLPESGENRLIITNRWGKKVFESDNYQNNWDGEGAADGVYYYRLQLAGSESITGWLEIIRGPKP